MTEILYFSFVFNDNDPFLIFLPIRLFVFDSGDFCSLSLVILHVFCYFGFAVHESSRVTKDIWTQYQDRWLRFKRKTLHAFFTFATVMTLSLGIKRLFQGLSFI